MSEGYEELALEKGRPKEPCGCPDCCCRLHTYVDDTLCVWCRSGDHGRPRCPKCSACAIEGMDGTLWCPVCGWDEREQAHIHNAEAPG